MMVINYTTALLCVVYVCLIDGDRGVWRSNKGNDRQDTDFS